jgi:hypothetical protein
LAGTWPRIVLKIAFAGSESSTNWAVSCCSKFSRASSLDLTSADIAPSASKELASSPSSSETSMAKENRLSGESCS